MGAEQDTTPSAPTQLRRALQRLREPQVTLTCQVPCGAEVVERVRQSLSSAAGKTIAVELTVNPRQSAGATLFLGPETKIDLDPGRKSLEQLEALGAAPGLAETVRSLSELVERPPPAPRIETTPERGVVLQVGDGVALVEGLGGVGSQEVVRFESGVPGIAFNLLEDAVGCLLLGPEQRIEEGSAVERTGRLLEVPVGEALIGRIVNALGQPLDGKGPIRSDRSAPIERLSPGIVQRSPVSESLHTGLKVLDALVPLGRGQRELILGDRKIGKTTVALDAILSQKGSGVLCVYAAIGQNGSAVGRAMSLLRDRGAMDYTIVVAALSSEALAFRFIAPYAACTMAEEFVRQGRDVLVVYDDLSKHAVTYREISALLKRPIGREAYPGDIFYVHSRLLERSARLRADLGGGSLTALPIVETLAGDISAFIPTNVISICDGQIFLDTGLFNEGFRPALDAGLSVSRVGGMAQTAAMRKVAGRLRIDLAQFHEMARFVKFGAEVDEATLGQLKRGEREQEVLKQDAHVPLPLEREIVILYAAVNGYTDDVALERLRRYEELLYPFLEREHPEVLRAIRETRDLPQDAEARLRQALTAFRSVFDAEASPQKASG